MVLRCHQPISRSAWRASSPSSGRATMRPASTACTNSSPTRAASASDDEFLLDHVALDAADELRAVGMQRLHLGRTRGGLEGGLVVEPQLGDAVDLDLGLGD